MTIPEKGFYVHYKHDPSGVKHNYMYEVIGIARDSEEKKYVVLYRPLYESSYMSPADYTARPLEMFLEHIKKDDFGTVPRFRLITDPDLIEELEVVKANMYGLK